MTAAPSLTVNATKLSADVQAGKRVAQSVNWLVHNSSKLRNWETVEDWAVSTDAQGPIGHHLVTVRAEMARQLWTRHLFVGVTVLDELLWTAVRNGETSPVDAVVRQLVGSRALEPAYVLYPLYGLGLRRANLLLDKSSVTTEGLARKFGIAVTSQTWDMESIGAWLEQVHDWFGVKGGVPLGLLQHWERSRAPWLRRNPLLAVKITAVSGTYYENQRLITDRLHIATSFLAGLAVTQPAVEDPREVMFTTSTVNNFATRDIGHYFVMNGRTDPQGVLAGDAVPMNVDADYLGELSDLPVILDSDHWNKRADEGEDLWRALNALGEINLQTRVSRPSVARTAKGRTARKLFTSLDYFRRSLGVNRWYATVSLGTAFEMLLTSHYQAGVTARLQRRATLLTGSSADGDVVRRLYEARSRLVHEGLAPPDDLPLLEAQRIFVDCLVKVGDGLSRLSRIDDDPLKTITGDVREQGFVDRIRQASMRISTWLRLREPFPQ
ncbi:hypothetical protein ACI789_00385 [Geodermatophilus sp. SYSU D00965]